MLSARRQGYHIEGAFVGGRQHNRGGASCAVGPMPIHGSNAPAVAVHESGKPVLRYRCREVVADRALVLRELAGHSGQIARGEQVEFSRIRDLDLFECAEAEISVMKDRKRQFGRDPFGTRRRRFVASPGPFVAKKLRSEAKEHKLRR